MVGQFFGLETMTRLIKTSTTTVQLPSGVQTRVGGYGVTLDTALNLNTAVSGLGGIDIGSIAASSTYYVYLVISSGVPYLIASLSANAPTGFLAYKKIGRFETETTSIVMYGWDNTAPEVYLGTLVTTGSSTTNTTYDFKYWRTAEGFLHAEGKINWAGAPNAFTALSVNLPNLYDFDLGRLPATIDGSFENFGWARLRDATVQNYMAYVAYTSTNLFRILYLDASAIPLNTTSTAPFTIAVNDSVYVNYDIPITGWAP